MNQGQQRFQSLSPEDVVSVLDIKMIAKIWNTTTVTPEELRKRIAAVFGVSNPEEPCYGWFGDGVEGKALIAEKGGGWKTGRVRLSVEFLPDEPTSIEASTGKLTVGLDEFR